MRKAYIAPELLVHGSVEEMTLAKPPACTPQPCGGGGQGTDPKPSEGDDGLNVGEGEAGGPATS